MAKQKLTFEASMQRLDEIVKQLEKGDVPLDASLALFEEGSPAQNLQRDARSC